MHITGIFALTPKAKRTIRKTSKHLEIETAIGVVHSATETKVYVQELGASIYRKLVDNYSSVLLLGPLCNELVCSYLWRPGENPMLTKGEITIECCVDNIVFWWRSPSHATDLSTQVLSGDSKTPREPVCLRKKLRRRCLSYFNRSQKDHKKTSQNHFPMLRKLLLQALRNQLQNRKLPRL